MPTTTVDGVNNPFEELDTDVELPEPVAAMPSLPPLLPDTNHQDVNAVQAAVAAGEAAGVTATDEVQAAVTVEPKAASSSSVTKSFKSTLKFTTDLTKSARDVHPCGILHFTRLGTASAGANAAEEHAFAWIAHQNIESHLNATLNHMARFGFTGEVLFIPYSSRRSWIEKYPLAFPHVYCGENGQVNGFPHWSGGGGHTVVSASAAGIVAAGGGPSLASSLGLVSTPAKKATKVGRKKKKIFPVAHLPNDERDELHIEMYKYFQWLSTSLANHAASSNGNAPPGLAGDLEAKQKLAGSAAGINVTALQSLMENMEQTFKVVRSSQTAIAAATRAGDGPSLPFLEEVLGEPLGKLAEANKKNPAVRSSRRQSRRVGLHFDDMYERLVQFHAAHGHVNVPQKYAQDGQLGSWVANMRSKRKAMAKRGIEYEPDKSYDNNDDDEDEDDDNNDEEEDPLTEGEGVGGGGGQQSGKKRKRGAKGRQRLTRDRVHRLDSIGFQWTVANPNTKSWDERFEDLKEYQQMHGTTRVPRSSGTLGEWVHMQRRLYNKKDKNFMAKKAQLLDDIGFEWQPRKHALVSWEDNFNRLVEFGRMNRHYNVQSPFPEGYAGDFDDQDGELVEAHRFSKWVKRIHAEYRSYASGKGSRMLNDARVMQLREIGFQFV